MTRRLWPYVGATKRVSLAEARGLGAGWAVQPKVDGVMVRLHLDGTGRVRLGFTRNELELELGNVRGARIGRPHAVLVGELEASTEAARAAARARGQAFVHVFDCLHDGQRALERLPYRARRDALWRGWAEAEAAAPPSRRGADGRFRRLRDTAVAPIVPQAPLARLADAWERVKAEDLEGLVLVALDAPAGARASKLKLKAAETIDARAVAVARTTVTLEWRGRPLAVARGRHHVELDDVCEIRHDGFYAGGTPRFAALVRVRRELQ